MQLLTSRRSGLRPQLRLAAALLLTLWALLAPGTAPGAGSAHDAAGSGGAESAPGPSDGGLVPGSSDGGLAPGPSDGGLVPGSSVGGSAPGSSDGGLVPGSSDGGSAPGPSVGGSAPGPPTAGSAPGSSTIAPIPGGSTGFAFDPDRSPFPPKLHAQVVEVVNHFYNFEFEVAREKAQAIQVADPGHPLGDFLLAEVYWLQVINNQDRPDLVEHFDKHAEAAIEGAERLLKRDDRDPVGLFFLGGVYGRKAILDGLSGDRFSAVNTSVKARKYLKLLNRHHPEVVDAYFGLGLYDYYSAQLPWFARLLSRALFGLGGNREEGITKLERAARDGLFTQVEARIFLAIVYLDTEGRYEDALAILKDLSDRYPRNLDIYGMLAFAYRTQHDYENAILMLEHLVEQGTNEPAFGRRSRQMSAYFLASTYKVAGSFDQAMVILDDLVDHANPKTDWLTAMSLLERGRIHDLLGDRGAAVTDYEQVLALKDFRDSHDKARDLISTPYALSDEERSHHLEQGHAGVQTERGDEAGSGGSAASLGKVRRIETQEDRADP